MAKREDIQTALNMVDKNDPAQWEAPGVPKLSVVQDLMNDDTVTAAEVAAVMNPGSGGGGEPQEPAKPTVAAKAAPVELEDKPDEVGPGGPGVEGVPPLDPENPTDPDRLTVLVTKAREALAANVVKREDAERRRDLAAVEVEALVRDADKHIRIIEIHGPRVTHAESVKAIQKQTQDQLAARKAQTQAVSAVIAQTGGGVFPSRLDAALATRKRTPEQVQRMATYIHQNAKAQIAERTGGAA